MGDMKTIKFIKDHITADGRSFKPGDMETLNPASARHFIVRNVAEYVSEKEMAAATIDLMRAESADKEPAAPAVREIEQPTPEKDEAADTTAAETVVTAKKKSRRKKTTTTGYRAKSTGEK